MRRIAYVFGWLAAAGAGTYVVIYLYRWQWQRAVLCGVLLLVVEVMLLGITLIGRLSRIEERVRETQDQVRENGLRQQDVLARLREAPVRQSAGRFRWLDEPAERTYVFVPVLMVTGVLLSGLAWVVQRVATVTAKPAERRLAGRLAVLAGPDPAADTDLEDLPPVGGRRSPGQVARATAVGAVGVALLGALVVGLADLTETREEKRNDSAATSILVQIDLRGSGSLISDERRSLAAHQVWEQCRDSTSVPLNRATLGDLGDGVFAGVVQPALTEHDRTRLRGCLEDATIDRAHLTVVGIGDADADEDG
ncbi:hypothetical protein [Streptomyces sp. NBC_00576]|uniref:hypothetical protein n=1 Tax=Streptomyces sp. NBC_00576 TaxID=2903665 RepID=UPI002E81F910|nr:hypothetical protein [Streptomyces sp. NBC_00576]WUB75251.1 hypothetical protein OG734_37235 [Streptomyces sp. NBC_00576]